MRETEEAGSSEVNLERIDKEGRKVMLSVGPFWLQVGDPAFNRIEKLKRL
jgi:hypothetical protein